MTQLAGSTYAISPRPCVWIDDIEVPQAAYKRLLTTKFLTGRSRVMWMLRLCCVILIAVNAGVLLAQHEANTPSDVQEGERRYMAGCSLCHGPDGDGVGGADLAHGRFRRASSDEELINLILNGIPGTAMPPNKMSAGRAAMIVAYLRHLATQPALGGNADRGRAILEGKGGCLNCHRVRDNGSRLGPEGEFLLGKPFVKVTWASGFDEKGRSIRVPGSESTEEGVLIFPGNQGGTNWYNPSYSPSTGLFYIPTWKNYSSIFFKRPDEYREGQTYAGGGFRSPTPRVRGAVTNFRNEEDGYGTVQAIDPKTGEQKWEFKMTDVTDAGVLTTASGLLFSGGREGYFFALDARTGSLLWKAYLGGRVASGPMTFSTARRQYVAVKAGNSLFAFALRQ